MILIYFTIFTLIGLLSYYLIFSCLSLPTKLKGKKADIDGISLIICAKNELHNLEKFLPLWLAQEGINFELIVVNDHSNDGSKVFLENLQAINPNLKTITLDGNSNNELKGKRNALYEGIQNANFTYLALSDADCYPSSSFHLKEMANAFKENTEVVLGYSPYEHAPGLLGKLINYETSLTALQYLSFAKIGLPYMGVGRNVAYKKDILSKEAFVASNLSTGGDDDLLIGVLAKGRYTEIQLHSNTHVYSLPSRNWSAYFKQKQRHYSTAKHYDFFKILAVGGFGAFNILFYMVLFTLLVVQVKVFLVLSLYLCKLLMFVLLNFGNLTKLKAKTILKDLWFIDLVFIFLFIFNHIKALKGKHGWS